MKTYSQQDLQNSRFESRTEQSWFNTVLGFAKASYTVFYVRGPLHSLAAKKLKSTAQPTQASLKQEIETVKKVLKEKVNTKAHPKLDQKELLGLMGVLMQFTAVLPKLRPYCRVEYADVDRLYKEIVNRGAKKPLGFAEQLAIALDQAAGNLPEALWRLMVTSRQFARWYDSESIIDMPKITDTEAVKRMVRWSRSLRATKEFGSCPDQEVAGDTYYCWTHALSQLAYKSLPANKNFITRVELAALEHGTNLNHKLAHRVRAQSVPSDHTIAAEYGNTIGRLSVEVLS